MKKILRLFLVLSVFLSNVDLLNVECIPFTHAATPRVIASGVCGDAVIWKLDESGRIIISGEGEMYDFGHAKLYPWYEYRLDIKNIIIEEGVTNVAKDAFREHYNVENIYIADTVERLEYACFYSCGKLMEVELPKKISFIADFVFYLCNNLTGIIIPSEVKSIESGDIPFHPSVTSVIGEKGSYAEKYASDNGFMFIEKLTDITMLDVKISNAKPYEYTGEEIQPEVTVSNGKYILHNKHYQVTYENNINPGIAAVNISGIGDYSGTVKRIFVIEQPEGDERRLLQDCLINIESDFNYTGNAIEPEVTITDESIILEQNVDYTLEYKNNIDVGNGLVIIRGIGDYVGVVEKNFTISEEKPLIKSILECNIIISDSSYDYDGKEHTPEVIVKDGDEILQNNVDYELIMIPGKDAGNYHIHINGIGKYMDSKVLVFTINQIEPTLLFLEKTITKKVNDDKFINHLYSETDGSIKYFSDNTDVATVNENSGEVEIVGVGTTTIRAKSELGTNYLSGETSYILNVEEVEIEKTQLTLDSLSYSFGNVASSFGYPDKYNYSLSTYQTIFGKTTKAAFWYDRDKDITGGVWRGNCAGFSGTSALLVDQTNDVDITDFNANAKTIGELGVKNDSDEHNMNITEFIEAMQIAQHTQLFTNEISENRVYTNKHLYKKIKNLNKLYETLSEETEEGRPVILGLYQSGAHAVLAYDVKDVSATTAEVYLYDSNWPNEERVLTLKKDEDGNFMEWSYEIGGSYGVWGTNNKSSSISYVPYSIIKEIWETKGNLEENENVLSINSGSVAIYTSGDKPVATVTQGELSTTLDDIQVIEYFALEKAETDTLLLSVPVDVYTFQNLDKSVDEFEVSVTNNNLGAKASTTAESVTIAVDDSCNLNAVYIDAGEDDTYSITLNSSFTFDEDNVEVTGKGNGETMEVSQMKGNININNCQITSIKIDGKEVNKYQITATAGTGGTITPEGDSVINSGENIEYQIIPNEGYMVSAVYVDGISVGAVTSYKFDNVSENHVIKVTFKKDLKDMKTTTSVSSSTYSSVTLKWNKISGAKIYQIYYSTSKSTGYKRYASYNSKTTSATVKSLKAGKTYYFRVRGYDTVDGKNVYSKFSDAVSKKPGLSTPTNTYVTKDTYSSVKVTWDKVSGATYYELWRRKTSTGTWKKIKTYTKDVQEAKVSSLETGTKYYFKVRARRYSGDDAVYSSYSNTDYATPELKKPTITVTKKSTTSVNVSWKTISGANGYQLYYASGSGAYKKLYTASSKEKSVLVKSLKIGKTYGYKLRAYRSVDGKKIYSNFSTIVKRKM